MRFKSNFHLIYLLFLVLIWSTSSEGSDNHAEKGHEIVVVGNRTAFDKQLLAADIEVITAEEIRRSGASNLIDVLRGISSIQIGDNNTTPTISLRGFSSQQAGANVLIILNGRRLNQSDLAVPEINSIPLNSIKSIEILNGSGAVLYGDQAVAGVIRINTSTEPGNRTVAGLSRGSFQTETQFIDHQSAITEQLFMHLYVNHSSSDQYRQHNAQSINNQRLGIQYDDQKYRMQLEIERNNRKLQTPGALLVEDIQINRRASRDEFKDDFLRISNHVFRLSSAAKLSSRWHLEADFEHNNDQNSSLTSFINFQSTAISDTQRKMTRFTPRLVYQYPTGNGQGGITSGWDFTDTFYQFTLAERENKQKLSSAYLLFNHPLTRFFRLSGGWRIATVNDHLTDALLYPAGIKIKHDVNAANLGLLYNFSQQWTLFSRFENNFRFAKVDEQSFTSPGVIGLKPQRGKSLEVGIRGKLSDIYTKLTLYRLNLTDEISFDPSAPAPVGAFFQGANVNADRSRRDGLTFYAEKSWDKDWQFRFNLNAINGRFRSGINNGNSLDGVSKFTSRLNVIFSPAHSGQFNLEHQFISSRFQEGDGGHFFAKLKSYSLVNLSWYQSLQGRWEPVELSARVDNLLNKKVIGFALFNSVYPVSGRSFNLSIQYRIAG